MTALLQTLKIIKRFQAIVTLIMGFTGCASELANHFCVP